jgi:hypothetical protein
MLNNILLRGLQKFNVFRFLVRMWRPFSIECLHESDPMKLLLMVQRNISSSRYQSVIPFVRHNHGVYWIILLFGSNNLVISSRLR